MKKVFWERWATITQIFTCDPTIQANLDERRRALSLISNKLSPLEWAILDKEPTLVEVEVVIKTFKSGKSPGLDDLTIEVLRACWEWIGKVCVDVVLAFWHDGILTPSSLWGVIKLIPKGGDGKFLKNWRPIMMLNLIYKIISKLLTFCI